ncbi:MAG TPA: transposase, partial [Ktedonobacterales bacterium]|nr:transposase [Ktedonobacterales bacterium]
MRVISPDRTQLRWDMVDLDSQLPDDHRARLVWAFVEGLDLSEFYDRIKARDAVAGRPATDPRVVLAVWLYATLEGIGSARAIDRLCQQHAAYRWLCGGAPINHDLLAEFRRENAVLLDRLLTQSVTGLIAEKLITLEELAIDGTKARACAGRGSMSKRKRLERIEKAVAERVAELKSELDTDPGELERQRKKRALQAAQERAQRVARARQKLAELEQEKAARAETHATEEANKGEPKVSVSDPEARLMRLADGAVAPAWNVQVATAEGFVVAIDPTDRRKDSGLAPGLVATVAERCGRAPQRLLADTTAMTREDIVTLAQQHPDMTVYSPPAPERSEVKASTLRARRSKRRREPPAVVAWRARMASAQGHEVYRRRKLTERAHGIIKNRGMTRFLVHGREKVRAVCLLQALALNLSWADTLR